MNTSDPYVYLNLNLIQFGLSSSKTVSPVRQDAADTGCGPVLLRLTGSNKSGTAGLCTSYP